MSSSLPGRAEQAAQGHFRQGQRRDQARNGQVVSDVGRHCAVDELERGEGEGL